MTNTITSFTFAEKALLRLQMWEMIERSRAILLEEQGLITIETASFSMDESGFDYPFGKVGVLDLEYVRFTDEGYQAYVSIFNNHADHYERWAKDQNAVLLYPALEQILCLKDKVQFLIRTGLRDRLVVTNRLTGMEELNAEDYEQGLEE